MASKKEKPDIKLQEELEDLKGELVQFQQEKERIRQIVGQIGGVPKFHSTFFNIILIIVTVVCLAISIIIKNVSIRLLMIEIASAVVSLKIIYLIHCQMRVNHFKLWVLSSIEWRINELSKLVKKNSVQEYKVESVDASGS